MLFDGIARQLLQFADASFGEDTAGRRMFTWWGEARAKWSELTVCAGAVDTPGWRDAGKDKGFVERPSKKRTFLVFREAQGLRPCLPAGREPKPGDVFVSASCLADAEGRPVDATGHLLSAAPEGAERWSVVSVKGTAVAAHWEVVATGISG